MPIQWEEVSVTPILKAGKTVIPENAIQSVKRNTVALKGEDYMTFPVAITYALWQVLWLLLVSF